jgi:hypothetical protein
MKRSHHILYNSSSDSDNEIIIINNSSNNNNNNNNNNSNNINNNNNNNNNNINNNNINIQLHNTSSIDNIIIITDSDSEVDIETNFHFDIPQYIAEQNINNNNIYFDNNNNNNNNNTSNNYNENNSNASIFCFKQCSHQCGFKICKNLVVYYQQVWKSWNYSQQQTFLASLVIPRLNAANPVNQIVGYALPVGFGNSVWICTRFVTINIIIMLTFK